MSEPLAELRGVSKTFHGGAGAIAAVSDVDLTLSAGEFVVCTGRSGSGKSTLLALLGTLASPTSGTVRLCGTDVATLSDAARARLRAEQLGFAFQFAGLQPTLSAFDNVRLPTLFHAPDPTAAALRARELLRRMGLGARLDAFPDELSGGEQRRVALARALLSQPRLLLADEPTGDLDVQTEAEVMELLAELHREGLTIVMVTHNLDLTACATRHLRLEAGRVVETA